MIIQRIGKYSLKYIILAAVSVCVAVVPVSASNASATKPSHIMQNQFERLNNAEADAAPTKAVVILAEQLNAECARAAKMQPVERAVCQSRFGEALMEDGQMVRAEPILIRAIAVLEPAGPQYALAAARARSALALVFRDTNRLTEAEQLLQTALATQQGAARAAKADLLKTLIRLSRITSGRGDYDASRRWIERARSAISGTNSVADRDRIDLYSVMVLVDLNLGNYDSALVAGTAAFALADKLYAKDDHRISMLLNNMASVYNMQGKMDEAEKLLIRNLEVNSAHFGLTSPEVAESLSALGAIYVNTRRVDQAQSVLTRAIAVHRMIGKNTPEFGAALYNMGITRQFQSRLPEAKATFENSLTVWRAALGPDHADVALVGYEVARLTASLGDINEAKRLIDDVLRIQQAKLGPDHQSTLTSLNQLGNILSKQGLHRDAAEVLLSAAARARAKLGERHQVSLFLAANASKELGLSGQTKAAWESSAALLESLRAVPTATMSSLILTSGKNGGSNVRLRPPSEVIILNAATADLSDSAVQSAVFEALQLGRQNSAGSAVARAAARFSAASPEMAALARQQQLAFDIVASSERRVANAFLESETAAIIKVREQLRLDRKALDETAEKLSANFPNYAKLANGSTVSLADMATGLKPLLKPNQAMFFSFQLPTKLAIALVTQRGLSLTLVDVTDKMMAAKVASLRKGLELGGVVSPSLLPVYNLEEAHALYQLIFGKLTPALRGIDTLYVVADGPLASLPFSILVTHPASKNGDIFVRYRAAKWLGAKMQLVSLPTAGTLGALRRKVLRSEHSKSLLAFADPALNGSQPVRTLAALTRVRGAMGGSAATVCAMQSLPETRREAERLLLIFDQISSKLMVGKAATERQLNELNKSGDLAKFNTLLFATHGLIAAERGTNAESALVLTPENCTMTDENNDGLLTTSEIARLTIDADWVILSGCNTAGSDADDAEPLSGLAQAFFYAGARQLLVSHWSVDSAATADLMAGLFDANGTANNQTLQRAMAKMRASKGKLSYRAHPAFWAPFVIVGDARH